MGHRSPEKRLNLNVHIILWGKVQMLMDNILPKSIYSVYILDKPQHI